MFTFTALLKLCEDFGLAAGLGQCVHTVEGDGQQLVGQRFVIRDVSNKRVHSLSKIKKTACKQMNEEIQIRVERPVERPAVMWGQCTNV